MADSVERLLVRIDATTEQLRRELKAADAAVENSASIVERAQARMATAWQGANKYVQQHQTELKLLGAAAVGGLAFAVKSIAEYSDKYKNLQGQLKLVTNSQEELNAVYNRALALSNETGASLDSTVNLYARMARASQDLGLSQNELFTITKSINQAFIVSGASAQEAEAAVRQLSQGMASGVLRGEELNSVMENSPRLARALADGLGVSIGQLREMGKEGELTSEAVTGALLKMSGSIDKEFQKMPMTVARATNEVKNLLADAFGKADLSPLVESIEQFGDVLKDPEMIAGLTALASGIVDVANAALQAVAVLPQLTSYLSEGFANAVGGPAADDMDRMASKIKYLTEQLAIMKDRGTENTAQGQIWAKELAQLNAVYDLQLELINNTNKAKQAEAKATQASAAVQADYTKRLDAANAMVVATNKELNKLIPQKAKLTAEEKKGLSVAEAARKSLEKQRDSLADYIDDLSFELKISKETAREQEILTAQRQHSAGATEKSAEAIRELVGALYDEKEAAKAASEATEKAARDAEKASEQAAQAAVDALKPWNDALQGMAEDIDSGFTQAWSDAFSGAEDGFKNFAGNIKDAFLNLLANMAHLAITRPIVMQISAAMGGLTGAAGAAAGVPSAGGAMSGSLFSGGLAGMGQGFYEGVGNFASNMGFTGIGDAAYTKGLGTTGWTIGGDIAGGFLGGLAGSKVFGETSGLGATAGGIAGSIAVPIPGLGAAIGSFLGTAIESGLDKLFGGDNNGNNRGYTNFDLASRTNVAGGIGKTFDQQSVDAASSLATGLQAFADAIGGSKLAANITVGGQSGIQYGGKSYGQDTEAFLQQAFDDVIRGSETLDSALKDLLIAFQGTAEETANYAQAMIQMSAAVQSNPVELALADMVSAMDAADAGMMGAYRKQAEALRGLISEYDGSANAAIELNSALQISRQQAYQLAVAIMEMSDAIGTILGDQAKYFREAVMTEDELRKARETQRADLLSQLRTATDPQQVMDLVNQFATVNKQIFDSLTDEQRKAQVGTFTSMTDQVETIAQNILGTALTDLKLSQDDINRQMISAVTGAAGAMQQAANDIGTHINTFGDYVARLVTQGINITISGVGAEVSA